MDFVRWYLSSYWYKCIVVPGTGQLKWYTTDHCGSDIECSHCYTAGLNQLTHVNVGFSAYSTH